MSVTNPGGEERLLLQGNTGTDAVRAYDEAMADEDGIVAARIWTRHEKSWKEVPRRVAVLDGAGL